MRKRAAGQTERDAGRGGADGCGWVTSTRWNDTSPTTPFAESGYVEFGLFENPSRLITVENAAQTWPGSIGITPWPYDPRSAAIFISNTQPAGTSSLFTLDDRGTERSLPLAQAPAGFGDFSEASIVATSFGLFVLRPFSGGTSANPVSFFDVSVVDSTGAIAAEASWQTANVDRGFAAVVDHVAVVVTWSGQRSEARAAAILCH